MNAVIASYIAQGLTIVPLIAGTKRAACAWSDFQSVKARALEADYAGGVAILCGAPSGGLVVLDFDDPALAARFVAEMPEFTVTHTIKTRRGVHYYFYSPHRRTLTQHLEGVDLIADGAYVCAPPTLGYSVACEAPVMSLTSAQFDALTAWLYSGRSEMEVKSETSISVMEVKSETSTTDILECYRARVSAGRNNALFDAARVARNGGLSQNVAQRALVDVFVSSPSVNHARQSDTARRNEALRTIASAYSRPARSSSDKARNDGLPNAVREALLQRGAGATARVLEVLTRLGLLRRRVDAKQIQRECVAAGLSVWTIRTALAQGFLVAHNNAIVTRKKATINRGRPAGLWRVPSLATLKRALGVKSTLGDTLGNEALQSNKDYRRALHNAFNARVARRYYQAILGARLGICARTIRNYNRVFGLKALPDALGALSWSTIGQLPRNPKWRDVRAFITDSDGKRYPALQAIAARLLARSEFVELWSYA